MFGEGASSVYGIPPGADLASALVEGLSDWADSRPPEALARVTVFLNTARMARRVRAVFGAGPPLLLPRIRLIGEIGRTEAISGVPQSHSPLRRRLELMRLTEKLLEAAPDLAPQHAAYDLADSLARLLDEIEGEGTSIEAIRSLDVSDLSGHWDRSLRFLGILQEYLVAGGGGAPDPEARQRIAIDRMIERWNRSPPADPVLIAGSTGSRGTTSKLIEAIARLPNGCALLPGVDAEMPDEIWDALAADDAAEDHPQHRLARLMARIGLSGADRRLWPGSVVPDPERNRLISLSLRPAPVTDQWISDGAAFEDLRRAVGRMTLVEAPNPRIEASAIALILRSVAEEGRTAALVSPDRMLTRRVTAVLDRWDIEPDDSAGRPLGLSAPGRFLGLVSTLFQHKVGLSDFLALLKNPICHSAEDRGPHARLTSELELYLRRKGVPYPDNRHLEDWAKDRPEAERRWAEWVGRAVLFDPLRGRDQLSTISARHIETAVTLAAGPGGYGSGELWGRKAGRAAKNAAEALLRDAPYGGPISAADYVTLYKGIVDQSDVRDPERPHPRIMIWGTLEARVQGTDVIILGGLNEQGWPDRPTADPWLNRRMRAEAGLLSPERRIGLQAHDYQQAIAGAEAVITRSLRDGDSEPVPSRWLNRLSNLLGGLESGNGPAALKSMRDRGAKWLALAAAMEAPGPADAPAPRPSPRPPVSARPKRLSVTAIEHLIRDPYSVYARHILGLRPLQPLVPKPDALLRGIVVHRILDRFMAETAEIPAENPGQRLTEIAEAVLSEQVAWPVARQLFRARIAAVAPWFVGQESQRAEYARFLAAEVAGKIELPEVGFTLHGRLDRVDALSDGSLSILDYKTGSPPTSKTMAHFDKQLLLEALIVAEGGVAGLPGRSVAEIGYIGVGSEPSYALYPIDCGVEFSTSETRAGLVRLIDAYSTRQKGYTARRAIQKQRFEGDYDHLSRFGEWDDTNTPVAEDVG